MDRQGRGCRGSRVCGLIMPGRMRRRKVICCVAAIGVKPAAGEAQKPRRAGRDRPPRPACRPSPEGGVAVREAAEAGDDGAVAPGVGRCRRPGRPMHRVVAQPLEQRDREVLLRHRLGMLEGQVQEAALGRRSAPGPAGPAAPRRGRRPGPWASSAKAAALPRRRLRGNWSSRMTSARAPSGVAAQASKAPAPAGASRPPKRPAMAASKAASARNQRGRKVVRSPSNQKSRIACLTPAPGPAPARCAAPPAPPGP